jgi:anti-sigma factor RsiW
MTSNPFDSPGGGTAPIDELMPLLDALLDGVAGPDEKRRLEELCAQFPECAREREVAMAMRSALESIGTPSAPPSVARSVFREVHRRKTARFKDRVREGLAAIFGPAWRPALSLASAAVVLLTLFALFRPPQQPEEQTEYTAEEVQAAVEELRWALGYVGKVGKKTGLLIRDEIVEPHVMSPINKSLKAAIGDTHPSPTP